MSTFRAGNLNVKRWETWMSCLGKCVAMLALCSGSGWAQAQGGGVPTAPKSLGVEDFLRPPAFANPILSRDGKNFAVTVPVNGRMNLAVVDLETRKGTALTNFSEFDVIDVTWVGNDYLLYSLGKLNTPSGPGQFDGGGLFMVSKDGKDGRKLSPTVKESRGLNQLHRGYEVHRTLPNSSDEIIAQGNMRSADSNDLYRLNVRTGRATLLTPERPEYSFSWVLDRNFVPRVVT
ncbi:MAG TPA: hypothetical protein VM937_02755, partial [Burkholderiaceae bacterium]|nr:hypothetical protein [Burkholderiaceae bacterium]